MRKIIISSLFILITIVAYYSIEIVIAHRATPQIKKEFLSDSRINLKFDELSERQQEIFIIVQDPNFWNHRGVEFSTPGSGWTTITQSIAKWFYFHPFKPGIRKIKQTLLARFVLHNHLSKEEQLLVFINHVWFDEGIRGFRNAANHFYQKNVDELTEDEFISLVAMPINPQGFNIFINSENNKTRSKLITAMLQGTYQPSGLFDIYYDR